jgi:Ca-activated chloride channel family protein
MTRKLFCSSVLLLICAAFTAAFLWSRQQQPEPSGTQDKEPQGFKIGVEVNMVSVPVTIRRPEGGFIKGLSQKSFQILEDGKPQEIVFFAQEGLPTHIALVLDTSGSVLSEWGMIRYATKRFLEQLKPEDQFSLTTFNTEIRLKMDWGRKTDRVDAVLTSIYCKDNTKLWDAIYVVSNDVFKGIREKKAMIIMSDGMDNQSTVSYEEALQAAVRSEAAIYVVSKTEAVRQVYKANYGSIPHEAFVQADLILRKLAYETGGRVLYPNSFGQLNNVYAEVYEELRNQYTVGYISSNAIKDGSYRHIGVGANVKDAVLSARPGYYAPDDRGRAVNR